MHFISGPSLARRNPALIVAATRPARKFSRLAFALCVRAGSRSLLAVRVRASGALLRERPVRYAVRASICGGIAALATRA